MSDWMREHKELLDEWFEVVSSNGVQCRVCGSTVQPAGSLRERHIEWHQSMDQAPDGR